MCIRDRLNTETDTVAENGDKVNIDYTGYMDGEKFEGGSTDGQGTDCLLYTSSNSITGQTGLLIEIFF